MKKAKSKTVRVLYISADYQGGGRAKLECGHDKYVYDCNQKTARCKKCVRIDEIVVLRR